MDFWSILIFGIIPVFAVTVISIGRRKLLWTAPFVSTALAFITYIIILTPVTIAGILSDHEWRPAFLLAMLLHLGIAAALTIIAYIAAYILNQKKARTE